MNIKDSNQSYWLPSKTYCLSQRIWRNLLSSFHSIVIWYLSYRRRKLVIIPVQLLTLWVIKMTCLTRNAHINNSDINTIGITNPFLIVLRYHSSRWNPCIMKKIIAPKWEANAIVLLNEHILKPNPYCIS